MKIKDKKRRIIKRLPLVSVVMPVYNAEAYLSEAIESVLNQGYKKLELIIVDDGSTDNSLSIIKKYARKSRRIKFLENEKNLGISLTVKKAIDQAQGDFIARMDADDVSYAKRIEKQLKYLLAHKRTVAIGSQCQLIDKRGKNIGIKTFPLSHKEIYKYIFEFIPLQQPSLMIARKRLPADFEFYKDGMNTAEEVELIFKLFKYGKVENLSDTLLKYRIHDSNTSLSNIRKTFLLTLISRVKAVVVYGYKPTLKGVFMTFAQTVAVLILPQKYLFSLYSLVRDFSVNKFIFTNINSARIRSLSLRNLL